jgi:hypothetical protein
MSIYRLSKAILYIDIIENVVFINKSHKLLVAGAKVCKYRNIVDIYMSLHTDAERGEHVKDMGHHDERARRTSMIDSGAEPRNRLGRMCITGHHGQ